MRKENRTLKQILAKLLVFALVFQLAVPVGAAPVVEEVSVADAVEEIEKDALPEVTEEETVAEGEGEEIIDAPAEWFQIENGVLIKYLGSGIKDDNRPVRVKIPDGVTKIKQSAFQSSNNDYKCNSKKVVSIDLNNVTEMETMAFNYMEGVRDIYVNTSLTSVATEYFYDSKLNPQAKSQVTIHISANVEGLDNLYNIGDNQSMCFDVDEKNAVYSSVDGCLYNKEKTELLKVKTGELVDKLVIPEGVTTLKTGSFDGIFGVKHVVFPSTLTTMEKHVFNYTGKDMKVTLLSNITSVNKEVDFMNYLPGHFVVSKAASEMTQTNIEYLTQYSSDHSPLAVTFMADVEDIGAWDVTQTSAFYVEEGNTHLKAVDGILYKIKEDDTLEWVAYPKSKGATELVLPGDVTSINLNRIDGIEKITTVTLSNDLQSILSPSTLFTNVTKLVIPKDATSFSPEILKHFPKLETVEVEGGNVNFKSVDGVLYSADGTEILCYPCKKTAEDGKFAIPEAVTSIASYAFCGSDRELEVSFHANIKSIKDYAFYPLTSSPMIDIVANGCDVPEIGKNAMNKKCVRGMAVNEEDKYLIAHANKNSIEIAITGKYVDGYSEIIVPEITYTENITVNGKAAPNAIVEVMYGDTKLGEAKADLFGRWYVDVTLPDVSDRKVFSLYSQVTPDDSETPVKSEAKEITCIKDAPNIKAAYYMHNGYEGSINVSTGVADVIVYNPYYPTTFIFEVENDNLVDEMWLATGLTGQVGGADHYRPQRIEDGKWAVQLPIHAYPANLEVSCTVGEIEGVIFNAELPWIIDPSGYVYETLSTDLRLEDVEMTIYYSEDGTDENKVQWDATPYYQKNPLMTDENGYYAWDVPVGYWKVTAKKAGYDEASSAWMQVPPARYDVNLKMQLGQYTGAKVTDVQLGKDKLFITFDRFVRAYEIGASGGRIQLTAEDGSAVEVDYKNMIIRDKYMDGQTECGRTFEIPFAKGLNPQLTYDLTVNQNVKTYRGRAMAENYVAEDLQVSGIVKDLDVQSVMPVMPGKEYKLEVELETEGDVTGRKVLCSSANEEVIEVVSVSEADAEGKVKLVLKGINIGSTKLAIEVEGTPIEKEVFVEVMNNAEYMKEFCEKNEVADLSDSIVQEDPEGPSEPTDPEDPKDPSEPTDPSQPSKPSVSDNDIPKDPTEPSKPEKKDPVDLAKATVAAIANQVYTGSALTPAVTVTVDGKTLVKDTDYTVAYANNTDAGIAQVTITGKGNYTGTKTVTFTIDKAASKLKASKATYKKAYGAKAFTVKVTGAEGTVSYKSSSTKVAKVSKSGKVTIKNTGRAVITASVKESKNYKAGSVKIVIEVSPKKAAIKTLASKKAKELTVTWKKDTKASGYEISYSTSKKFKKSQTKKVLVKKNKTTKTTIKKLKKGKTYYVKVRAYKEVKVNGKKVKIYSPYSKVLKKKVK